MDNKERRCFQAVQAKNWSGSGNPFGFYHSAGNSHVQAAVKEFTTKIGELMGFSKDLSAYTEVINQVQTKNGISLTINEVILDNYSLIVSVKPDYEEKKGRLSIFMD